MTKCDFCTKSLPNGKCWWWPSQLAAEDDCDKAIKRMTKALSTTKETNVVIKNK